MKCKTLPLLLEEKKVSQGLGYCILYLYISSYEKSSEYSFFKKKQTHTIFFFK